MNLSSMQYYKQQKGYSFAKLSELSGVPLGTIQKIFSGETKSPRYETLRALEEVLKPKDYTQTDLLGEAVVYDDGTIGLRTLEDYYALPDERRVELIDGVFYDLAAPSTVHQIIAMEITHQILNFVKKNKGGCVPLISPVDVQLDCDEKTMVQPDVLVVCDKKKIKRRCVVGAPDFVAEILSKSCKRKDAIIKLKKYCLAGVKEYWMIDPDRKSIVIYHFAEDDIPVIYGFEDEIPVWIYDGRLKIDFKEIAGQIEIPAAE